jgi:hypothetical protein
MCLFVKFHRLVRDAERDETLPPCCMMLPCRFARRQACASAFSGQRVRDAKRCARPSLSGATTSIFGDGGYIGDLRDNFRAEVVEMTLVLQ